MGLVRVQITQALLLEAPRFLKLVNIVGARIIQPRVLELILQSQEFPEQEEGKEPPLVTPKEQVILDWGLPK